MSKPGKNRTHGATSSNASSRRRMHKDLVDNTDDITLLPDPTAPSPEPNLEVKSEVKPAAAVISEALPTNTTYPTGKVVKSVTAKNYKQFETEKKKKKKAIDYCPKSDIFWPHIDAEYELPPSLNRSGLQVTKEEFSEILHSLNEASNVTFCDKSVDCSLPCLFLTSILVIAFVSCSGWLLIAGSLSTAEVSPADASLAFWSFMVLVILAPSVSALVILAVVLHLVNYKYLKYRIKVEEFNKRFREANLVLHIRQGFWVCSGNLKLYFIHYNFEKCQQTLYCHVHDNITLHAEMNEKMMNVSSNIRLDKIMKRVNTLTKKYEWPYFEALTRRKLPAVDDKEHRKEGMCFCQYVLHSEKSAAPYTLSRAVRDHVLSMKKSGLFSKSHRRRSERNLLYNGPITFDDNLARFSSESNNIVNV